jgi:uncharacterized protein with HEPN domain
MPSERAIDCFKDIVGAIDLIKDWIGQAGGIDQVVHHNVLVRSGIERQLLVVSEAATRLHKLDAAMAPALAPEIDWPGIRGIGNFIRHKYDDLDSRIIIEVLENRLDVLRAASQGALSKLAKDS